MDNKAIIIGSFYSRSVYATVKDDLPHLQEWIDIILQQEAH